MEPSYTDHDEIIAAVRRVQRFLSEAYISDGCGSDNMTIGCASCQAKAISDILDMVARDVEGDLAPSP